MIFNRIICPYLLLFLIGCDPQKRDQPEAFGVDATSEISNKPKRSEFEKPKTKTLEKEDQDLIAKFIETLAKSGSLGSKNPFDVIILLADYREKALKLVNDPIARTTDFLEELQSDARKADRENMVQLKNKLDSKIRKTYIPVEEPYWAQFEEKTSMAEDEPLASKLSRMANDDKMLDILMAIKNSFYKPNGELSDDAKTLKKILLEAANDPIKKKAFLAGQVLGKCIDEYIDAGYDYDSKWVLFQCGRRHPIYASNIGIFDNPYKTLLMGFANTPLKKNIAALTKSTGEKSELEDDELTWIGIKLLTIIDYDSLRFFHKFVAGLTKENLKKHLLDLAWLLDSKTTEEQEQLLAELKPQAPGLGYFLFEFYTENKLPELSEEQLRVLIGQLVSFLNKSRPRK
jgi:hypothetical protein